MQSGPSAASRRSQLPHTITESGFPYELGTAGRAGPWHTVTCIENSMCPDRSDARVPPLGLTDGADATPEKDSPSLKKKIG